MKGLAWLMLDKVGIVVLSTLSTFWYAKLLGPEGFGQAVVILAVYQILVKVFGVIQQAPLVALQGDIQLGYNTSFVGWSVISVFASALILGFFGVFWGKVFVYYAAMPSLALLVVMLSKVYLADLLRRQKFKDLAYRQTISRLIALATGLFLAYRGYPMWAVIVQWSLEPFISYWILRKKSSFAIGWKFDGHVFWSQLKQGSPLLVKSLSSEMKGKGLIVFLGVTISESASAYYSLALKFVEIIRSLFVYSFSSFSLPRFVELRDNKDLLVRRYESLVVAMMSIMVPVCFGIASLSVVIVSLFFSPEWEPVSKFIYWLFFLESVSASVALVQPFQVATFNTRNTLFVDCSTLVLVPLVFLATVRFWGYDAALIACFFHTLLLIPFYSWSLYSIVQRSLLKLYQSMFFIVIAGLIMALSIDFMNLDNENYQILAIIAWGVFCYSAFYLVFLVLRLISADFLGRGRLL